VSKKRLLIFTHEYPPFSGGIASYAAELARAAADSGLEVHVVAPDYGRKWRPETTGGNLLVHRTRASQYNRKRLPWMLCEVLYHLNRGPWDYVHAADIAYITVLAFVARFSSLKFLGTAHGTDILSLRDSFSAALLCNGNPYAYCDRVLCNSHFTRDLLHQTFPSLSRDRSLVTHLGVNSFWLEEDYEGYLPLIKNNLAIGSRERVVLTVSRIDRRKGHLAVIDALDQCWFQGVRDIHYVIVGATSDGPYEDELKSRVKTSPFPITLAGFMEKTELRALYRNAKIFCMPGIPVEDRIEGFGLAYLEAAACSLPCIGTDLGGVAEVIRDQETGILLSSAEPALLCAAILSLLIDEPRRRSMATEAHIWARSFTWSRCALLSYGHSDSPRDDNRLCAKEDSQEGRHSVARERGQSSL
jgi:phosphatidylinositol alpha-1,6-mannosyltransferase